MKNSLKALCAAAVVVCIAVNLNAQSGQAPHANAAMDINNAKNANMSTISSTEAGPYEMSVAVGGVVNFQFFGEGSQPIILVSGDLNPGIHVYTSLGGQQWDIGQLPLGALNVPAGLTSWADGNVSGGLNDLFHTNPSGFLGLATTAPMLPIGVVTTFQAVIRNSVQIISFSNAVQFSII